MPPRPRRPCSARLVYGTFGCVCCVVLTLSLTLSLYVLGLMTGRAPTPADFVRDRLWHRDGFRRFIGKGLTMPHLAPSVPNDQLVRLGMTVRPDSCEVTMRLGNVREDGGWNVCGDAALFARPRARGSNSSSPAATAASSGSASSASASTTSATSAPFATSTGSSAAAAPAPPIGAGCVVYSLGSDGDFSFDMAAARIGCEVHTFDPSLAKGYASSPAFASIKARFDITLHEVGIGPLTHPPQCDPATGCPPGGLYGDPTRPCRCSSR